MNRIVLLICLVFFTGGLLNAQTLEELQTQKAELAAKQGEAQAEADKYAGELAAVQSEIDKLAGWIKGFGGNIGFDFNKSNNWISTPNPDASSSSLNIGLTAFANKVNDGSFWNNKGILTKSWQDVDLSKGDGEAEDDNLFDNGTVDILNLSSLYGHRLSDAIALSGLGELNSSLGNFLEPGTFDIGTGVTYTGIQNLVVVLHPLNYHIAFPVDGAGLETSGALGAKLRADYTRDFTVSGKKVVWSSTLTSFLPYSDSKSIVLDSEGNDYEAGLFEYSWLNTLSFEVWKGIGVGLSFGLRDADFEDADRNQNFYALGLTYVL